MPRRFNTAGPCIPSDHYMLPPEARLSEARRLIDQQLFFILHAPRQTGKTTLLNSLALELNREGRYTALVLNVEFLQQVMDVEKGNIELIKRISNVSRQMLPPAEWPPDASSFTQEPFQAILSYLQVWSAANPKPVVLFIDEIDSLPGDLLISVLRQLRAGYSARPAPFLHAVILVGLRDVRDYRIRTREERDTLGTASPFNIKSESLLLRDFNQSEVGALYAQHTAETGQVFFPEAVARAFELTQGQPWLEREGYLVIFDRRPSRTWEQKLYMKELEGPAGKRIHVVGA